MKLTKEAEINRCSYRFLSQTADGDDRLR